nr:MAG TPA: hypothetical protein [Caudoviricetes sp.]
MPESGMKVPHLSVKTGSKIREPRKLGCMVCV